MAKFAINASGAMLLPSLVQVSESTSGSVVPLAMFYILANQQFTGQKHQGPNLPQEGAQFAVNQFSRKKTFLGPICLQKTFLGPIFPEKYFWDQFACKKHFWGQFACEKWPGPNLPRIVFFVSGHDSEPTSNSKELAQYMGTTSYC